MAEEKIVKINLRKQLSKVPKWKRKGRFSALLRRRLKTKDLVVNPKLNERVWSNNSLKVKLKIVKEDKSVKANLIE